MDTKKTGKSKTPWKPGAKVSIGGREYKVLRREEDVKGKPWVIQTMDGSRTYQWRAFHGLTLTSGQPLVRPRQRGAKAVETPATVATASNRETDILNLVIDDIRQNPRKGTGRFLSRMLSALGLDTEEPTEEGQPAAGGDPDLQATNQGR